MIVPAVHGYGTVHQECCSAYLRRWPDALKNFPSCVVENWVHRHWQQFKSNWASRSPQEFTFRLERYTNNEIMCVGHVRDWLTTADHWGEELFTRQFRRESWLGAYMLKEGTTPVPIIVSDNSAGFEHPEGGVMAPFQLIEGHLRLSYLRGMIHRDHAALRREHLIWVVSLPNHAFKRITGR